MIHEFHSGFFMVLEDLVRALPLCHLTPVALCRLRAVSRVATLRRPEQLASVGYARLHGDTHLALLPDADVTAHMVPCCFCTALISWMVAYLKIHPRAITSGP